MRAGSQAVCGVTGLAAGVDWHGVQQVASIKELDGPLLLGAPALDEETVAWKLIPAEALVYQLDGVSATLT